MESSSAIENDGAGKDRGRGSHGCNVEIGASYLQEVKEILEDEVKEGETIGDK